MPKLASLKLLGDEEEKEWGRKRFTSALKRDSDWRRPSWWITRNYEAITPYLLIFTHSGFILLSRGALADQTKLDLSLTKLIRQFEIQLNLFSIWFAIFVVSREKIINIIFSIFRMFLSSQRFHTQNLFQLTKSHEACEVCEGEKRRICLKMCMHV